MSAVFPLPALRPASGAEIVIDSFAGGGGASQGIFEALGRHPDVAINHDPEAVAMHAVNHPGTAHHCQSVYRADPRDIAAGRPVGLLWASPDCKHFSKAKGGQPLSRNIRDLAWVVVHFAERVAPRVIILENVEEFRDWGPLIARRDDAGAALLKDGRPVMVPDPARKGETFRRWVRALRRLGYRVDWRELRACDYGAPTIRKRLFVIARRDGRPIVWPAPTHGPGLLPWRTAAEIIDWSLPCPSIFLTREEGRAIGVNRPLAAATMARIAAGVRRYVLDAAAPFLVPVTHGGDLRCYGAGEPLRTVTTAQRGEFALVAPSLVQTGYGERPGQAPRSLDLHKPLGTVVAGGQKHALVAAFLAQHNTGAVGHEMAAPLSTVTGTGSHQQLVASHLLKLRNNGDAQDLRGPAPTLTAGGQHLGEVRAFLTKYYGAAEHGQDVSEPLHSVTAKPRFGLVTLHGEPYEIADIGMRMLTPRELFRAQGFPDDYVIDFARDGRPLSKASQVRMCGNSVCPPLARALVAANVPDLAAAREAAE